ncbi:MAG: endonuclease/exonuclease/phosphatase family protein [Oscillospiraceae bacterium]|nr:endonuclease/exonuclease/phosphatase family protein [Oscillospiraceae bacterium]
MKLLTLNTPSLVEDNYSTKLDAFVSAIAEQRPDIIALQEVNQTIAETQADVISEGYVPCVENIVIRKDNHVYKAAELLENAGVKYYWTWLPLKKGYDKYDEGISLMSRSRIIETDVVKISETDDYNNWKTRKIIGIRTEAAPDEWFFSVHYGWWDDLDEPFQNQWQKTVEYMKKYSRVWLMGDFNSPAEVRNEGYDMMNGSGWYDSYTLAKTRDNGITVGKVIDGWRDKVSGTDGMRIDQIWCSQKAEIASSEVIFNGANKPVVSDHYGVAAEYERSEV